jgi:hypothetical protein
MFGCVDEANPGLGLLRNGVRVFKDLRMQSPPFLDKLATLRDQMNHGFRLMYVKVVDDKNPLSFWIGINHFCNMKCQIFFSARGSLPLELKPDQWRH